MRQLAILGASSQIAKDLILASRDDVQLLLYVRDVLATQGWLEKNDLGGACSVFDYSQYGIAPHEAVINFVGVGDPQRAAEMGSSIFGVTSKFDQLAMSGLISNPDRRYIFLSSGAAYGSAFPEPVDAETPSRIDINSLPPQEFYAVAKLHAEAQHRANPDLAIVDVRVFNYFSRTQDLSARFLITDVVRSIRDGSTLSTSSDFMVRDFLNPVDFRLLVNAILDSPPSNDVVDCFTLGAVEKSVLLDHMRERFGLRYEVNSDAVTVNATGKKPHYYSLNRRAEQYGYRPTMNSMEGISIETAAILAAAG